MVRSLTSSTNDSPDTELKHMRKESQLRNQNEKGLREMNAERRLSIESNKMKCELQAESKDQFKGSALRASIIISQQNARAFQLSTQAFWTMTNQSPLEPLQLPDIPEVVTVETE